MSGSDAGAVFGPATPGAPRLRGLRSFIGCALSLPRTNRP